MARTYSQLPLALWHDPRFLELSDEARLAFLYIWAGPHSTSAGVGVLRDGYAATDLGWTAEKWQVNRETLEDVGMIYRDQATETILAPDYLTSNRPSNVKHLAAVKSQIATVGCPRLKAMAEEALTGVSIKPQAPEGGASPQLVEAVQRLGKKVA